MSLSILFKFLVSASTPMPSNIRMEKFEFEEFEVQALVEVYVDSEAMVETETSFPLVALPRNPKK